MKKDRNSCLQTILSFIALGIAIYAIIIAQKTLDNSNSQFKQNMQSSDSLFNYQLQHSKKLNDSLIYQISELQKITNSQLSITDEHLKISIQTLQEELYFGRPKIIIGGSEISDTNMIIEENIFSPKILTYFTNIGKRPAKNFNLRAIVVYTDLSGLRTGEDYLINTVDPGPKSVFEFKPRIPLMYKDDYYYCVEIK